MHNTWTVIGIFTYVSSPHIKILNIIVLSFVKSIHFLKIFTSKPKESFFDFLGETSFRFKS